MLFRTKVGTHESCMASAAMTLTEQRTEQKNPALHITKTTTVPEVDDAGQVTGKLHLDFEIA